MGASHQNGNDQGHIEADVACIEQDNRNRKVRSVEFIGSLNMYIIVN